MSRLNRLFEEDILLQESLSDADNLYDDNEDTIIGVLEDRDLAKEAEEKVHLFENNKVKEPDYELRGLIEELVETEEDSINEAEITDIYNDPDLDLEDCLLDDDDDLGGML